MKSFICLHCHTVFASRKLLQFCTPACRHAHKITNPKPLSDLVGDTSDVQTETSNK